MAYPWLVKDGDNAWYASTVPVGRSCARFAALDITLSVTEPELVVGDDADMSGSSSALLGVCGGDDAIVVVDLVVFQVQWRVCGPFVLEYPYLII